MTDERPEAMGFDFDAIDFVTSDHHFGHARISELADRPFGSVDEMNSGMIERWNQMVGPDDIVLHLGDLALGPIEQSVGLTAQLHGRRLLVPGNHDRVSPATQSNRAIERFRPIYEDAGWTVLSEVLDGHRHGRRLLASHYPFVGDSTGVERHSSRRPNDSGVPLVHGHTHDRGFGPHGSHEFHVGVDAFDFRPVPFDVIDRWLGSLSDMRRDAPVPVEIAGLLDRLYVPSAAQAWLRGHNANLDGARPIDLLLLGRESDVIDALKIELEGGMT